jgi:hypothetical protein
MSTLECPWSTVEYPYVAAHPRSAAARPPVRSRAPVVAVVGRSDPSGTTGVPPQCPTYPVLHCATTASAVEYPREPESTREYPSVRAEVPRQHGSEGFRGMDGYYGSRAGHWTQRLLSGYLAVSSPQEHEECSRTRRDAQYSVSTHEYPVSSRQCHTTQTVRWGAPNCRALPAAAPTCGRSSPIELDWYSTGLRSTV